jgi:hypothetical protein
MLNRELNLNSNDKAIICKYEDVAKHHLDVLFYIGLIIIFVLIVIEVIKHYWNE